MAAAAATRISNGGESELPLSELLSSMIREYRVLVDKSQLPIVREMKSRALQKVKLRIAKSNLPKLNDKQIMKKIANMKNLVKRKTDAKATGKGWGKKHVLCHHWEQELYDVLKCADDNPRVTKMPSSLLVGSNAVSSSEHASDVREVNSTCARCKGEMNFKASKSTQSVPVRAIKREYETEETTTLSTMELQRLVLLEQLKCTRMKIRRMERQHEEVHADRSDTQAPSVT